MESFVADGVLPNELRAHIYQQLAQLEVALPKDSSISITLHDPSVELQRTASQQSVETPRTPSRRKKRKDPTLAVIEVTTPLGQFTGAGTGENLYEAVIYARESMNEQLTSFQLALDNDVEREQEVDTALKPKYLH